MLTRFLLLGARTDDAIIAIRISPHHTMANAESMKQSPPVRYPVDENNRKIRPAKKGVGPAGRDPLRLEFAVSDERRWQTVYPVYLNKDKTIAEGRRLPLDIGIDHPTCADIMSVCDNLDLPHKLEESKCYSRDFYQRGRVRVQLKQTNGSSCNSAIHNNKQLFRVLARQIPMLPQREANRKADIAYQASLLVSESMFLSKEEKKELEREQQQQLAANTSNSSANTSTSSAGSGGGGGNKKKNRKR